ncbi:hypothetical protein HanXRQr2_Chr13g0572111 [Helianthus annuus]|uniref:Uncharacterized protein n=1 Tax=Helianthus annuus TaxID=4232 RepID=A0A9K3EFQ5_HELAN|nr:hypothetical protein HanXRQr2_Chr13g0572111 [Helianthus annuus]KAJ0496515.1 hypothetical protein HanHA89_Chr13g0500691 [Helianthus annuus]
MGFGKILKLKVSDINASLAYFVVDRLDTEKMKINHGDRQVKVDKECIHRIMGVPYGGIRVVKDAERCSDAEKVVEAWKNRFVKVPISCSNIVDKIRENCYEDEEMFKIDFAMLFIATMIASTKNGHAMYTMLRWFCLSKEFKEHDWCQLIMDTIRVCKSDWDRSDRDSFFRGSLTVLVVVDLSKGDNENGRAGFDGMSVEADGLKRRLEEAVGQLASCFPNSEFLLPALERYKMMFNKSVVDDKGEPSGVKSDVERKKDDVSMKGNKNSGFDKGDGFSTPHVASTFTQNVIMYTDVLEDVLSGAYETQRRDDMPSFDLGLSQPLPSTQEVLALREETVKNVESEADVCGKGKRKKQISKYGKSPFLL